MFCPHCGSEVASGKFCPVCGKPMQAQQQTQQRPVQQYTQQQPVQQQYTQQRARSQANVNFDTQHAKENARAAAANLGAAAAGAGAVIGSAAASAGSALGNAAKNSINTARENAQKRQANIASGAAAQSALGMGGLSYSVSGDAGKHIFYNTKKNLAYFKPPKIKWGIIFFVIGIILLSWSAPQTSGGRGSMISADMACIFVMVSLVLIVIGIVLLIPFLTRPKDVDIDNIYARIAQNGVDEAESKADLDPEETSIMDPVVFCGPSMAPHPTASLSHLGKDAITRWSNYQVTKVFCTEHHLYYYNAAQSLIEARREATTIDVYYSDIAIFEIQEGLSGIGNAIIHTTSGDKFDIPYNFEQAESIRALRSLIRERKAHNLVEIAQ